MELIVWSAGLTKRITKQANGNPLVSWNESPERGILVEMICLETFFQEACTKGCPDFLCRK